MGDDPHGGDPLSRGSVTRQGTEGRTRGSQTAHHWVGGASETVWLRVGMCHTMLGSVCLLTLMEPWEQD